MGSARRAALGIGLVTLIGACVGIGRSSSLRASFAAASRAFLDPSLLERAAAPLPVHAPSCAPAAEEARAIGATLARELRPATDEDLDDPGGDTLASLVMPDLRVPITRRTLHFVRFFTRTDAGRALFAHRFHRAGAYRDMIERALREAGLPEDLLWVAAVESGFDPRAVSPVGAAGLWQFMPKTADAYGLERSDWVDERMSLSRATAAAVAHLRDLHERFGRWDLSLAAYNLGHDGLLRAMQRAEAARLPSDRGPLGLAELAAASAIPEETADYVPKVVAFALVAANRARFGLDQPELTTASPLDLGELAVPEGTRLRTIARSAGISTAALREHNPELLRDRVPPAGGDYLVALPADRVARALSLFPVYLNHDVLTLDGGEALEDAASATRHGVLLPDLDSARELGDEPLPLRPAALGRNRLPLFSPPGFEPTPMPLFGNPQALEANRPVVLVGGGGQRPFRDDPLGLSRFRLSSKGGREGAFEEALRRPFWGGREPVLDMSRALLVAGGEHVERFRMPNGVAVELRPDPAAPLVSINVSVASPERWSSEPAREAHLSAAILGEARATISVAPRDLEIGIDLVAARLRWLLDEGSSTRVAALRRQAGAASRRALEESPYGSAWLALGEALFPAGHPLEGTVVGLREELGVARDLLLTESLLAERRASRATIALTGDVTRSAVEPALQRALAGLHEQRQEPIRPHPREERILVEAAVPSSRLLYGWIAPIEGDQGEAALRVAMEVLCAPRIGRLVRVLVDETRLSVEVTGRLSSGERATVAWLEISPAAQRDEVDLERRLDAELAELATSGPTPKEVARAKATLRRSVQRELAQLDGSAEGAEGRPPLHAARLRHALDPGRLSRQVRSIEGVRPAAVRAVVAGMFARDHRVVVTSRPRGDAAALTAGVVPSLAAP